MISLFWPNQLRTNPKQNGNFFRPLDKKRPRYRQSVTPTSSGVILRCSCFFWVDLSNLSLPPYVSSPLCWKSSEIPFFQKLNHSKPPSFSSHGLGTPRTLGPSPKVKLSEGKASAMRSGGELQELVGGRTFERRRRNFSWSFLMCPKNPVGTYTEPTKMRFDDPNMESYLSGWWLNQPIWKIWSSKWDSFPKYWWK